MENALELSHVSKRYGAGGFALEDVSLTLPMGSIMGLVGANGAGKSTTIGCMLGTLRPDAGTVRVFGQAMQDSSTALRADIGVVYDGDNFPGYLTAAQLGRIFADTYARWDAALFDTYLARFHLDRRQRISRYSKGMTMALAISAALAHHPKLLVLDEATSGLDPLVREDVLDLLLDFVTCEDHAILLSSHITSDLEKIADRLTFIHEGRVLLSEEKDTLRYRYGILRCRESELAQLDSADILAWRRDVYQTNVLVADRVAAARKYPGIVIDQAAVDEVMNLLVKGERHERIA